ncbi:hypothetical protein GE09DRAFT_1185021 [Coniochaeta sp. 2T2.1]|nr:hypothetical protein GE09DRAFT_1185021 [Coniochaeta sp. 2T2.1]
MADPVSLAASIVAFIEITDRVIRTCKHCIDAVKDAPHDVQMILGEVMSLRTIMNSFNPSDELDNTTQLDPRLLDKAGPIEACRRCLVSLEALLPPYPSQGAQIGRRRITFAELAWPLKESKARKLLAEVSLHKSTLLLAITGDIGHDIKGIRSGVDRVEQTLTDAQRQEVYRWLETTNPSPLHNLAVQNHERETGTWLLRLPQWNEWLHRPDSTQLLWLHGIPGAGKTVLASFLIEVLKDHCNYSDQDALEAVLAKFQTFYVAIDAVDESSPRDDLLAVIAVLAVEKRFHNLKILATSRPYFDIETKLKGISVNVSMSNPEVEGDIRRMVHSRLRSSRRMKRFPHLLDSIQDALASGAQGMFRWAHCQLYNIEQLRDESQILAAIKNLPKDLAETYARGLGDIPECDRAFVRRVSIWIVRHTLVPSSSALHGINAAVLLSAVSYDLGLQAGAYTLDDARELCGCLADVSVDSLSKPPRDDGAEEHMPSGEPVPRNGHLPSKYWPSGDNGQANAPDSDLIVSLAHYTVSEFLQFSVILETHVASFSLPLTTTIFEYTASVLCQALQSDPTSPVRLIEADRETYCLIQAGFLSSKIVHHRPDILDLFLAYFNPNNPHYRRFQSIKQQLIEQHVHGPWRWLILYLPSKILLASTMDKPPDWLATVLNLRVVYPPVFEADGLVARCMAGRTEEEKRQLDEAVLVVSYDMSLYAKPVFQGTIGDIEREVHGFGSHYAHSDSEDGESEFGEECPETMSARSE